MDFTSTLTTSKFVASWRNVPFLVHVCDFIDKAKGCKIWLRPNWDSFCTKGAQMVLLAAFSWKRFHVCSMVSSQEHFPRQDRLWITDLSDTAGAEFWPAHLGREKIEEPLEVAWNEGDFNQRKCQTYGTLRHAVLLFSFNGRQLVVKCRMLCSISLLNKPSQKWEPP